MKSKCLSCGSTPTLVAALCAECALARRNMIAGTIVAVQEYLVAMQQEELLLSKALHMLHVGVRVYQANTSGATVAQLNELTRLRAQLASVLAAKEEASDAPTV